MILLLLGCSLWTDSNLDTSRKSIAEPKNQEFSEVISYRELHLIDGVREKDFEVFVINRLIPTFDKNVPGVTLKLMKGDRGEKKDTYVLLIIFDSSKTRDFYFPTEQHGETNMPETALTLWRPGQKVLIEEFDNYVEPLENNLFTDFNVLR
jgi:hypothetical protein